MEGKTYKVGLYIRLSREDGDNLESESVKNQRDILNMFLGKTKEKLFYIKEYVDDGFTGSNFDRPSWKQLLLDIESKKINTIITKDLSRMGRDYISMGNYIEKIFPEKDIRYIAINDDIDTLYQNPGLDFLQFKLVFNDYYLKDTSKKIRKVLKAKKEQGQFLGWKAVYGYMKDPNDRHKLIVDKNVSYIVERMFKMVLEGKSPSQIANIFSLEKIPNPSSYANLSRGLKTASFELWCPRTIKEMLLNQTYIGNLTQGRRRTVSYKCKKGKRTAKEEWIVVENTHEAIIDRDTFKMVQDLLKKGRNKSNKSNLELLSGFMYCKECGHAIGLNKSSDGKRKYCVCTYYLSHSRFGLCTSHSNNYEKLENLVLDDLRRMCKIYVDKSKLKRMIEKIGVKNDIGSKLINRIGYVDNRIKIISNYIDKIYEDKLSGNIDIKMFQRITVKYKKEIKDLEYQKDKLKRELLDMEKDVNELKGDNILTKINEYLSLEGVNRNLLVNLIEKIYINEKKEIEIYYKFSDVFKNNGL